MCVCVWYFNMVFIKRQTLITHNVLEWRCAVYMHVYGFKAKNCMSWYLIYLLVVSFNFIWQYVCLCCCIGTSPVYIMYARGYVGYSCSPYIILLNFSSSNLYLISCSVPFPASLFVTNFLQFYTISQKTGAL